MGPPLRVLNASQVGMELLGAFGDRFTRRCIILMMDSILLPPFSCPSPQFLSVFFSSLRFPDDPFLPLFLPIYLPSSLLRVLRSFSFSPPSFTFDIPPSFCLFLFTGLLSTAASGFHGQKRRGFFGQAVAEQAAGDLRNAIETFQWLTTGKACKPKPFVPNGKGRSKKVCRLCSPTSQP